VLCLMFIYAFILYMRQGSMIGNLDLFMFAIMLVKFERVVLRKSIREKLSSGPAVDKQLILARYNVRISSKMELSA
jgi:hypothetical protein